jgi:uncharacterized protein YjlB
MSTASPRKPRAGSGRTIPRIFCASESRRLTVSRMTGLFLIILDGRFVIYKSAVRLPEALDPAAVFEDLFESNGWGGSWRDGIYDYAHYHSRIHEVLGIARGSGRVQFGGPKGRTLVLKAGDVAILPAGMGHQCLKQAMIFWWSGRIRPQVRSMSAPRQRTATWPRR